MNLIDKLADLHGGNKEHTRKLLIHDSIKVGREALAALAKQTGGWIGWEATTIYRIAEELSFSEIHSIGKRVVGDIERRVLANRSFDTACRTGLARRFAELEGSLGFRQSLLNSVLELRMGGIKNSFLELLAAQLRQIDSDITSAAVLTELKHVKALYEEELNARELVDTADVFAIALEQFDIEQPFVLDAELYICNSPHLKGLRGELVAKLIGIGAQVVSDQIGQLEDIPCDVELFAASTPTDEMREVLRRVLAEDLRWDEVAIVASDVERYGVILDTLSRQLNIPITISSGISPSRTRVGRSLESWFQWISGGLHVKALMQALEAGEVHFDAKAGVQEAYVDAKPSGRYVSASAVARELRKTGIGWGRQRYLDFISRVDSGEYPGSLSRYDGEDDHEFEDRKERRISTVSALYDFLITITNAIPVAPQLGVEDAVYVAPSSIAAATLVWIDHIPTYTAAEKKLVGDIEERLHELVAHDNKKVSFSSAVAIVRGAIADVKAWPVITGANMPWAASGGAIHLSDISQSGLTGRTRTFVVGMDSEKGLGRPYSDPLLNDSIRAKLPESALQSLAEKRDSLTHAVLSALSGLKGKVTFSYSVAGQMGGAELGPSPVILNLYRKFFNQPTASFSDLRAYLSPIVSPAVNRENVLDARDIWISNLLEGPLLLAGEELVREAFVKLNKGLSFTFTHEAGPIPPHLGRFQRWDRQNPPISLRDGSISTLSPSAMEKLSTCPLSWLYRHGIGLSAPPDVEFDADCWLDSAERGSVLHLIYEKFAALYMSRQDEILLPHAADDLSAVVDQVLEQWKRDVPPPSQNVYEHEAREIRESATMFLEMERSRIESGDGSRWEYLEYKFGYEGLSGAFIMPDGSSIGISGRVDRIDRLPNGRFRAVDYKTGSLSKFAKASGIRFNGWRNLQPALYSAALEDLLGEQSAGFEYHFPTQKGQQSRVSYSREELQESAHVIEQIIGHVDSGCFIPTNDSSDCRFCDYQSICRSKIDGFGSAKTPRVEWARKSGAQLEEYVGLIQRRAKQKVEKEK